MTAGHKSFTLAADNESDMQDWLTKLQSVLNQNKIQEDTRSATLEREKSKRRLTIELYERFCLIYFFRFFLNQHRIRIKIRTCLGR